MSEKKLIKNISIFLFLLISVSAVWATDYVWDGSNWSPVWSSTVSNDTFTFNGNYTWGQDNLSLQNNNPVTIGASGKITFGATVSLPFPITNNGAIEVTAGTITIEASYSGAGSITNSGTIIFQQTVIFPTGAVITNNSGGTISSDNGLENNGTLNNSGTIQTGSGQTITNTGTLTNSGSVSANVTNTGTLNNGGTGSITGDVNNNGTFYNSGNVSGNTTGAAPISIFLGTTDNKWSTASNWNSGTVPGAGVEVTIKHDCILDDISSGAPSKITVDGNHEIDLKGNTITEVIVDTATITNTSATDAIITTLTNNENLTVNGNLSFGTYNGSGTETITINSGAISYSGGSELTIPKLIVKNNTSFGHSSASLTISSLTISDNHTFTSTGYTLIETLTLNTKTATINGTNQIYISNFAANDYDLTVTQEVYLQGQLNSLTITDGTVNLTNDLTVGDLLIDASSQLNSNNHNISVSGNWTNSRGADGFDASTGTVTFTGSNKTISGSQTFNNVVFSESTNITGSNTFTSLTCNDAGGKTLTYTPGVTTTITGTIAINGTSTSSLLTLTSTGEWNLDVSAATFTTLSNLDVKYCTSTSELTVSGSKDSGYNTNWNFEGQTYTWTGNDGTDSTHWAVAGNWSPSSIPGKGSDVIISTNGSGPVLGANVDLGSGTVSITNGAVLDLNEKSLTAGEISIDANSILDMNAGSLTAGTFTLNGKLRIKGSEIPSVTTKNLGDSYTLEYYGTSDLNTTFFNSTTIPNVIIYNSLSKLNITGASQVAIIENNGEIALQNKTLTVTTSYRSTSGTISSNGGTLTNGSSSEITIDTLSLGSTNVSKLAAGTGGIKISSVSTINGKLETSGTVSLAGQLTSLNIASGTVTSTGNLEVATLTNSGSLDIGSNQLEITSDYTGTSGTITINGGTLTNSSTTSAVAIATLAATSTESTIAGGTHGITISTISGTNVKLKTTGEVSLNGTLDTLKVDSGTTTLSGVSTISNLITTGETVLGGALTAQNITIAATTGKLSAASNDITVTGDWTNNRGPDGFNAAGNKVTFTPASPDADLTSTLTGQTSFYIAYFNGKAKLVDSNTFASLNFTNDAEGTISTAQTVNGRTYIQNSSGKTLTFTAENIFDGDVSIGTTGMSPSYAGTITLQGKKEDGTAMNIVSVANATALTVNSPVVLNCNVNTTGTQTYNNTIDLNSDTTLTSINDKIVLTANVTSTTSNKLTFASPVVISEDITLSASSITFNSTVDDATAGEHTLTLAKPATFKGTVGTTKLNKIIANDSVTITEDISISANELSFANTVDATGKNISFDNTTTKIGGNIIAATLSDNGDINFTTTGVNLTANVTLTGSSKQVTGNNFTITGDLTNSGSYTVNVDTSLTGNFTDNGTWNAAAGTTITLNGTSTDGRTFKPAATTTYENIILDNDQEDLTVTDNSLKAKNFTIYNGKNTTFYKSVEFETFTDTVSGDSIIFTTGGTITNGLTHTTGSTSITGTLTTSNADVTLGTIPVLNGTINAGTGNVTFNNNITLSADSSITAGTTTFAGTTTLSGGKLSITGNAEVATSKALEIATGATLAVSGDYTNNGTTTANGPVNVAGDFEDSTGTWSGSATLTFDGTTAQNATLNTGTMYPSIKNLNTNKLTFTGNVLITSFTDDTTSGETVFSGTATLNSNTVFNSDVTISNTMIINGNLTNEGTFTANADVKLTGNFTDNGIWTAANGTKITLDGTSTDGRTFVPGTSTYDTIILDNNAENLTVSGSNSLQTKTFTITSGKETSFEKSVIITTDFTITSATTTSFNEAVTIPTFTDTTAAGTINFNAGGTITSIGNSGELLTTSPVNFGDGTGTDSLTITNGIKHTAGSTSIKGTLATTNADVEFDEITSFNGTLDAGTGTATFNNNITLSADSSITASTTTFAGTTTLSGGTLTITGNAEVSSSKSLKIATGATLAVSGDYTNNGTTTANGPVNVAGDFEDSTGTWSGSATLTFDGTTAQNATLNTGTTYPSIKNSNTNKLTFTGNVLITSFTDDTSSSETVFSGSSTFGSDTTFNTTGSVTFGSTSTNIIDFTDGTSRKALTHTAGPTVINGTVRAAAINLGNNTNNITTTLQGTINSTSTITIGPLLITGISGHLIGPTSIQIGATTTDAPTEIMNLFLETPVLKSSSIGTSSIKFKEITIGIDGQDLSFDSTSGEAGTNSSDINALRLIFRGNNISLRGLAIDDELSFSTSKTITLDNIKAKTINFPTTEYLGVILKNTIETTSTEAGSGLNFQKPVTLYANTELKSKDVTFGTAATINSDGNTPRNLKISTTTTNTFGAPVGGTKKLGEITLTKSAIDAKTNIGANITATSLTDDGNVAFTNTGINLTANVSYSGAAKEISGNNYTITGNLTNSGSITYQVNQTITGNLTDTGTWTSTNAIILSGNGAQTVTPKATTEYNLIQIQKSAGSVIFINNTFQIKTLKIDSCPNTAFEQNTTITHLENTATTGNITFNGATTTITDGDPTATDATTPVTFNTTGTVTFGNDTSDNITFTSGVIHIAGATNTKGNLKADKIDLASTILTGNSNYEAVTSDISFAAGSSISGDFKLTLKTPEKINLKDVTVSELIFADSTAIPDKINLDGDINITNRLIFPFDVTLSGPSTIQSTGDAGVVFPDGITVTLGSNPLNITAYTLFNSTLNGTGTLTNSGDLIINNTTGTTTLNATVKANNNFVVFNGNLNVSANIDVTQDLIFFGAAYNTTDHQTNLANQYNYYEGNFLDNSETARKGKFKHNGKFPDGSAFPSNENYPTLADFASYSAILTTSAAVTIKAGQNFYANGLTATGNTDWYLKLRSNKNTNANYARAYYCDFTASSCNVSCFESGAAADAVCIAAEQCTVKNQGADSNPYEKNWDLSDFEIIDAYTVHDNIICIKFNRPVRNLSGIWGAPDTEDILNAANTPQILFSADGNVNTGAFENFYKNFDYNQAHPDNTANTTVLAARDGVDTIYIRTGNDSNGTNYTWNTDATGITSGHRTSTNTYGEHKTSIPYLNIKRNAGSSFAPGSTNNVSSGNYRYFLTDLYGKRLNHYYSDTVPVTSNALKGSAYTAVHDCCSPVMVTVKTGQELHQIYDKTLGESSQHSYDSHNFIEFSYSEAVNFGSQTPSECDLWIPALDGTGTPTVTENIKVTNMFGALSGDITTQGPLNFTGLGTIANGKIHTGIAGTTDATMNALYRTNEYSVRLSIAGYTNGTIADKDGNVYKNWEGYIENAVLPSGTYSLLQTLNPLVTDIAGNQQKTAGVQINVDSQTNGTYGTWDISEPVFALCRLSITAPWGERRFAEAVGTGSGSTLDKIEFHFFDNTPLYTQDDLAAWFTQKGWCINDDTLQQPQLYDPNYSYCADIIGGSRYFNTTDGTVSDSNRTTGGIRFSTTAVISSAFKYSKTGSKTPDSPFTENISGVYPTVTSPIFTGSSSPRRSADDPDGLYFGLGLPETNLPVETTFTVSYDDNVGYLTDLAGNRLRSDVVSTIDRTPPSLDMSLSPINQDELFVIFVKELVTDSSKLMYLDSNGNKIQIAESYEEIIPYCFDIISIDNDGTPKLADIQVDRTTPAKVQIYTAGSDDDLLSKSTFTFITLKLTRNLTLKDIQTLHLRLTYPEQYTEKSTDPVTSIKDARVTLIQDAIGNYTQMYTAHALSEFLIGGISPMYAYDADMTYGDETIMYGLYEDGSWAVHDWEADQQNYGTLPQNHPIALGVQLDDGTTEQNNLPGNLRIFLSNAPDAESVSAQINTDFARQLRVWLPSVTDGLFPGFALSNNTNYSQVDSRLITDSLKDGLIFDISKDITSQWANGSQVSFLFGLLNSDGTPFRFYNSPFYDVTTEKYDFYRSTAVPLYSMRLHDPTDILSLDLWSFKLRSITEQRGGVTILNNVINSNKGEKVVVKVNIPADGKLNVIVMTLDGNVVQYLAHGQTTAGEHYYSWNGKNKNGVPVARGMYFIRVVGNGFDETRKVMVVK